MFADVDCSAISELRFELFGQDGGGREAPDQLLTSLTAIFDARLITNTSVIRRHTKMMQSGQCEQGWNWSQP